MDASNTDSQAEDEVVRVSRRQTKIRIQNFFIWEDRTKRITNYDDFSEYFRVGRGFSG
jgi:hypothetical protein